MPIFRSTGCMYCIWCSALGVVAVVLRSQCVALCTVCNILPIIRSVRLRYLQHMVCSANNKLSLSRLLAFYFASVNSDLQVRTTRWRHRGLTPITPVAVLATYHRHRVTKEHNMQPRSSGLLEILINSYLIN